MSKEVWIIGVDPPCPRCDLTRQRVESLAREPGSQVKLRHLVYGDAEAKEFAASIGKELGTAKHVAEKAGLAMDWDRVSSVVKNPPEPAPRLGTPRWPREALVARDGRGASPVPAEGDLGRDAHDADPGCGRGSQAAGRRAVPRRPAVVAFLRAIPEPGV